MDYINLGGASDHECSFLEIFLFLGITKLGKFPNGGEKLGSIPERKSNIEDVASKGASIVAHGNVNHIAIIWWDAI